MNCRLATFLLVLVAFPVSVRSVLAEDAAPAQPADVPPPEGDAPAGSEGDAGDAEEEEGALGFWKRASLGGSATASYGYNFAEPPTAYNDLRVFDTADNSFTLDFVHLNLQDAPTDWLRFRFDFAAGDDVAAIDALKGGVIGTDELGFIDAYVEVTVPLGRGLVLRAGEFETLIGYEVIDTPANSNLSRSLLFGWAIPFTHTGVLATYAFSERVSASAGLVNGWDLATDNNSGKTALWQLAVVPFDTLKLSAQGTVGPERAGVDGALRTLVDLTATFKPSDLLALGANYDVGNEEGLGGSGFADWSGVALYVDLRPVTFAGLSLRGEWFREDVVGGTGLRTAHALAALGLADGDKHDLYEATATGRFFFAEGWEARLEYRRDMSEVDMFPTADGASDHQDTLAAGVVYAF